MSRLEDMRRRVLRQDVVDHVAVDVARRGILGYINGMENMVSRNVNDIPEASRRSLESLLGYPLQGNQRVFIMVLDPASPPSDESRRSVAQGLRAIIDRAQRHADSSGFSDQEADAAVEEAMEHIRRRAT
jgi:hypothetical protein